MSESVFAIYCDCNSRGGVWTYTLRTLRLFRHLGYRCLLVTHDPRSPLEHEVHAALQEAADAVLSLPAGEPADRQVRRIARWLDEQDVDVFVPNYRRISYAAAVRVVRRRRLLVLGICHADQPAYYQVLRRHEPMLAACICAVGATAELLRDQLGPTGAARVRRIPHYVEPLDARRAGPARERFRVVYHGRLREEQKHCSEILRVARRVCQTTDHVDFLLVGDGPDAQRYRTEVADLGLEARIRVEASRDWSAIWETLVTSQLGILTSAFEGFCYGAAEALTAGLPVVSYDCGGVVSDYLIDGSNGHVVPWGDADALADRIRELAGDPARWRRFAERARQTAHARFGFEPVTQAYRDTLLEARDFEPRWPRLRPAYIPVRGRSPRAFVDRIGASAGLWSR